MKTSFYLLLVSTFLCFSAKSQITITDFHFPSIGNTYNYSTDVVSTLNIGQSGENQIWDFSSVVTDFETQVYATPETGEGSELYPTADMVEILYNGENYYEKTDSTIALTGNYVDTYFGNIPILHAELIYTDAQEIFYYPMTYGDQYSFTIEGDLESDIANYHKIGTVKIIADGYGSLILPYGTIENVLKVSAIYNYTQNSTPIIDTISLWYNEGTPTYIASYTVGYSSSNRYISAAKYLDESQVIKSEITSIIASSKKNFNKIYPNPNNGKFTLESSSPLHQINIYNAMGQKITEIQGNLNTLKTIDLSSYGSGIYLLESLDQNNKILKRIIVK